VWNTWIYIPLCVLLALAALLVGRGNPELTKRSPRDLPNTHRARVMRCRRRR